MNGTRISVIVVLICIVLMTAFAVIGCILPQNNITLQVVPAGEQNVVLEYGQAYEELGAKASVLQQEHEPIPLEVSTEGTVNDQQVGTYLVRYTARHNGRVGTAYRRVRIADTQAPVITLVADPNVYTLPNETYKEEGFSATDNYDGDLTDAVTRTETPEAIIYTVTDSSGNETTVTRPVVYNDPTPPELTLYGEDRMVIDAGTSFREPGYIALDNCDGDVSKLVVVSGWVNPYATGNYTLTYTVSDQFGNTATATRTVFVKEWDVDKINDTTTTSDKVIYLTFDDGPGPETPRLLDVLKKYNVQATFFVVNTSYISTIQRAAAEGHTVAMHTMTHKFHDIYASEEAFFADLEGMQSVIESYTGQKSMLMRFPGGSSNTISRFNEGIMTRLTQAVTEKGYVYFDWNVDSKDAGGATSADEVFGNVIAGIGGKTSSVVLMHDIKSYTVDAIEAIIVWGLNNGYTFQPLSQFSPTCHHPVLN